MFSSFLKFYITIKFYYYCHIFLFFFYVAENCLLSNCFVSNEFTYMNFFSIWIFFHEYSRFTVQQGKGEAIALTPLNHFHPLHRHLHISLHIREKRKRRRGEPPLIIYYCILYFLYFSIALHL